MFGMPKPSNLPINPDLIWKIDEAAAYFERLRLAGWCYLSKEPIVRVHAVFGDGEHVYLLESFGQPSPDVAANIGEGAKRCRFDDWLTPPRNFIGRDFSLVFETADGMRYLGRSVLEQGASDDRYFQLWASFAKRLDQLSPGRVLEVGSRARSAITRRELIPWNCEYIGIDICEGPNVDIVGDAHKLASLVEPGSIAAIISFSVFEHLAMPWKVALEFNKVLRPGGIVFTQTHQTWPVHEEPWDFWRYSEFTWNAIFNSATGFRVLEVAVGEPARIHSCRANPVTRDLPETRKAYLGSSSIVEKVAESKLEWPVPTQVATQGEYSRGNLQAPPQ